MRLTGARAYARSAPTPKMPPGLVELMEGLAKDVLKNNPENIYEFCAAHMQKLLEIRDGAPPPKKQLSLEQKIAIAQEKVRQRIRNRELVQYKNSTKQPIKNQYSDDKQADNEVPVKNESPNQPVVHGEELIIEKEVEISHEPDVLITTSYTIVDEAAIRKHEIDETSNAVQEKTEEKQNVKEDVATLDAVENVKWDEKKVSDEEKEIVVVKDATQNEIIVKPLTETDIVDDTKASIVENIDHVENIPQHEVKKEAQVVEAKSNNADGKVVNDDTTEAIKDDLNEVASTLLLASKTVAAFSNISAVQTTDKSVVKEPETGIKSEVTDEETENKHEEIMAEKNVNQMKPEGISDTVEEHKEIIKVESPHIQNDLMDKNVNSYEANPAETMVHSDGEKVVEQIHGNSFINGDNSEDVAASESSGNQLENQPQKETLLAENQVPSTNTGTPESSNFQVSVEGAEFPENRVITEETKRKATVDGSFNTEDGFDVHDNQLNLETIIDKELTDINDKLPEQKRAHSGEFVVRDNDDIRDDKPTINKEETIPESDEGNESTAVSDMNLETAAITIQKVFRTFLFSKSRASTLDDNVNENSLDEDVEKKDESEYLMTSTNLNKERRTLGISRMDTVLQTVNEEKSMSLSDDSSLSSAATTIQAHVRGFLVRNRLASNKTASSSSLVNSDGPSTSLDGDVNEPKKTILNIHIVPERGQFMSRDESLLTSIDLPLDNSPPSSVNLHPLGYDKSAERRKQLKREDAIQSISPPSNNSGKLSEEVESVKEAPNNSLDADEKQETEIIPLNDNDKPQEVDTESCDTTLTISSRAETVVDTYNHRETPTEVLSSPEHNMEPRNEIKEGVSNSSSDEMDVVTPAATPAKIVSADTESDEKPKLIHSGEFHDLVVQTQVKRSEASVVREFKNVLVYFLLWDKA